MPARTVHTDVSGLEGLIDLPKNVASVRWEHVRTRGGSTLAAVVALDRPEIDALLRDSPKLSVQSPVEIEATLLEGVVRPSEDHEGGRWQGVNIDPSRLVNSKKSGLLNGIATVVADKGFVYLALYEM